MLVYNKHLGVLLFVWKCFFKKKLQDCPDQTTEEVAVPVLWPIPEVAVTVFSAPDDGRCDARNM